MLSKYSDDLITKGFLQPREYASLKITTGGSGKREERENITKMHLSNFYSKLDNTIEINKNRTSFILPSYEIDYEKHKYAHKYCLKLFFGFFNGTR